MLKTLVIKFGGTSLMTTDRIISAANIVAEAAKSQRVAVVVSAMGHTTDELLATSSAITRDPNLRELDALLATGELVSASLMTMALQSLGLSAKSFNGLQAGILTDNRFGNARIASIDSRHLQHEMRSGAIPVVAGFQGYTRLSDTTTIGRGGSDITAIYLAAALHAERCDIYSDVDGVYSCDPRLVEGAAKIESISFSEMLELAKAGAQILNARSVEIARDKNVQVRVRSTFAPNDKGTSVTAREVQRSFTGLGLRKDVECIEIQLDKLELAESRDLTEFPERRLRTKHHLLQTLLDCGINAEIVEPKRLNPFKIFLVTAQDDGYAAVEHLKTCGLKFKHIMRRSGRSAIGLVASQISSNHLSEVLEVLKRNSLQLFASSIHDQRMTVVVPATSASQVLRALHAHFGTREFDVQGDMTSTSGSSDNLCSNRSRTFAHR